MTGEPRAGDLALVDAEVEALGSVGVAHGAQRSAGERHELEQLVIVRGPRSRQRGLYGNAFSSTRQRSPRWSISRASSSVDSAAR
jgi:hypothetical protein